LFNLLAPIIPATIYTAYQFGGQYFDAETSTWHVTMTMFDQTQRFDPKPVKLTFSVKP
jgi:hypothetical protein